MHLSSAHITQEYSQGWVLPEVWKFKAFISLFMFHDIRCGDHKTVRENSDYYIFIPTTDRYYKQSSTNSSNYPNKCTMWEALEGQALETYWENLPKSIAPTRAHVLVISLQRLQLKSAWMRRFESLCNQIKDSNYYYAWTRIQKPICR